eukprot:8736131-Pyramimonas_sp.AAC.1
MAEIAGCRAGLALPPTSMAPSGPPGLSGAFSSHLTRRRNSQAQEATPGTANGGRTRSGGEHWLGAFLAGRETPP